MLPKYNFSSFLIIKSITWSLNEQIILFSNILITRPWGFVSQKYYLLKKNNKIKGEEEIHYTLQFSWSKIVIKIVFFKGWWSISILIQPKCVTRLVQLRYFECSFNKVYTVKNNYARSRFYSSRTYSQLNMT